MYRIIAKFDARNKCLESIEKAIKYINDCNCCSIYKQILPYIDYDVDAKEAINFEININMLLNQPFIIDIYNSNTINSKYILQPTKMLKAPQQPLNKIQNNTQTNKVPYNITDSRIITKQDVTNILQSMKKKLEDHINKSKLTIIVTDKEASMYTTDGNKIILNTKKSYFNLVNGGILYNVAEETGIETEWYPVDLDATFNHELGHYFRIYLEQQRIYRTAGIIGSVLLKYKIVDSDYVTVISNIWTNAEEINEIFGLKLCIFNIGANKYYVIQKDRINQSEYNLARNNGKFGVRYGHIGSRLLVVPYKLFCATFGNDDLWNNKYRNNESRFEILPIKNKTLAFMRPARYTS